MRTGIFISCVGRQHAGPEVYERNLVRSIAAIDAENEYDVICLGKQPGVELGLEQKNFRVHCIEPASRWFGIPIGVPAVLMRHSIKLFHATLVPPPVSPAEFVLTQHDVSPFLYPELYPRSVGRRLRWMLKRGLRNACRIICISQHAKESTEEMFRIPADRMTVVHHGVHPRFRPMNKGEAQRRIREKFNVEGPFVLFIGKLESRKNIVRLIDAFAEFSRDAGNEWKLVLAGRRFWNMDGIDEAVKRNDISDSVIELGYVEEADKPWLYGAAEIFAFPTLWEGFGLPVLEAMACGTPVVTSRVSCLPEVAGAGADLVDPYRVDEIAGAMQRLAADSAHRADLCGRAIVQARRFSWEETARKTIAAYRDAHEICSARTRKRAK